MVKRTTDKNPKDKRKSGEIHPRACGLGVFAFSDPEHLFDRPALAAEAGIFVKMYSAQIFAANFVQFDEDFFS